MSAAPAGTSKQPPTRQPEPERKRGFPSPFTILILVIAALTQ